MIVESPDGRMSRPAQFLIETGGYKLPTAAGVPCLVYVHRIAVPEGGENWAQFDAELQMRARPDGWAPPATPNGEGG